MSSPLHRVVPVVLASLGMSACDEHKPAPSTAPSTVAASVSASVAASGAAAPPDGEAAPSLAEGAPIPDVTLVLHDGSKVALKEPTRGAVLVYFYPKDDTPGCTVEAQGLRDRHAELEAAGVVVYGVSTQDAASHSAFIDKHDLPFSLVVDDGAVARAFGVPLRGGLAARQSFLLAGGKVAKVWRSVTPSAHADEVLTAAKSL